MPVSRDTHTDASELVVYPMIYTHRWNTSTSSVKRPLPATTGAKNRRCSTSSLSKVCLLHKRKECLDPRHSHVASPTYDRTRDAVTNWLESQSHQEKQSELLQHMRITTGEREYLGGLLGHHDSGAETLSPPSPTAEDPEQPSPKRIKTESTTTTGASPESSCEGTIVDDAQLETWIWDAFDQLVNGQSYNN